MSTQLVETNTDIRRHELLADVAEQTATQLIQKHGVSEDTAIDIGNHLADFFSQHWKGQNIYMNGDTQFKLSKRDMQIYQRMQRGNAHEIAKEFGISYVRVYQIYKRVLAAARAKNQPQLFADQQQEAKKLSTGQKASE